MYKYKVFVRAPLSDEILEKMKEKFDEVIYLPWDDNGKRFYEDEMLENLLKIKPDILITELDRVTEKVLSGYDKLKLIGDCRSGPSNIDIKACNKRKIPIICTPARNAQAVAEMLSGLVIAFYRNLLPAVKWAKDGKWVSGTTPYYIWTGNELYGKKIGFVGFGAVGKAAAKIFKAYNCDVYYYDPYVDTKEYKKQDLEYIFSKCDIVSIHLPVLESTKNMIDKRYFSLMKSDALFVNTSRSAVVVEEDLFDVLENKKIRGAILDVLPIEPPNEEINNILKFDNILLTPHICGATHEVVDHQSRILFDRLMKYLNDDISVVYNKDGIR